MGCRLTFIHQRSNDRFGLANVVIAYPGLGATFRLRRIAVLPISRGSRENHSCAFAPTVEARMPEVNARRVLVVEDDAALALGLQRYLHNVGYLVVACPTVAAAHRAFKQFQPDVIILDWILPDGDGAELCGELRQRGFRRPILFLTARDDVRDKDRAFAKGCNDYLVKPTDIRELALRIEARIADMAHRRLFSGSIEVDLVDMEVFVSGKPVEEKLTLLELRLLNHFLRAPGRVATRGELLEVIFRVPATRRTKTVAVHVHHLRRKLGPAGDRIETVEDGYRLDPNDHPMND